MCGLCAALNASNGWNDVAGKSEFAVNGRPMTRREERDFLVGIVNRTLAHYGISVNDWGGSSYVVTNRDGKSANVFNLSGVWNAADAVAALPTDPLDENLLNSLEKSMLGQQ